MPKKADIIREFLPESVSDIVAVQIDLDTTGLGIADILRNLNSVYPDKSRERINIKEGRTVIGVLCKSDLLDPIKGIFLVISNSEITFNVESCRYILLDIDQDHIRDEYDIAAIIESISIYLFKEYGDDIPQLSKFYEKYVYDEFEQEAKAEEAAKRVNHEIS